MIFNLKLLCIWVWAIIFLSACGGGGTVKDEKRDGPPTNRKIDLSKIKNPVPKKEKKSRYGNPKSYVVFGKRYYVMDSAKNYKQRGYASWYGKKFHGRRTSSGETYDMYAMTAAHKSLPLPTYVRVNNLENGRSIIVKVNDRGPFHEDRIIDLSYVAALKLDVVKNGVARVEVVAIDPGSKKESIEVKNKPGPIKNYPENHQKTGFYIQAGAFSSKFNAGKLQGRISDSTAHLVTIRPVVVNEQTLYRVLVGPVSSAGIANNIVKKLETMGISNPKFVK